MDLKAGQTFRDTCGDHAPRYSGRNLRTVEIVEVFPGRNKVTVNVLTDSSGLPPRKPRRTSMELKLLEGYERVPDPTTEADIRHEEIPGENRLRS